MRNGLRRIVLLLLCLLIWMNSFTPCTQDISHAQGVTAITPNGLGTTVAPPRAALEGTIHDITGGTRAGTNLFHGFDQFSVGANNIANFQNTPVNGTLPFTDNILSRVTGGTPSEIFGTLRTTDFGNANLFLFNPAGVLFGGTASLDIGAATAGPRGAGSFFASTADYAQLGVRGELGSGLFSASPLVSDVLTSAPVTAFGFLSQNPAAATIMGSTLQVSPGQTLALAGGNQPFQTTVGDSVPEGVTMTGGALLAPSGQVIMASVASPGELVLGNLQSAPNVSNESFTTLGSISLTQAATLDVSGAPGGTVRIRGGQFVMDSSAIRNVNLGDEAAGSISLDAEGINVTGGAQIISASEGSGPGAAIDITATDTVLVSGFQNQGPLSEIASFTSNTGDGGSISIIAPNVALGSGGRLRSEQSYFDFDAAGVQGNITVEANSFSISGFAERGLGVFNPTSGVFSSSLIFFGAAPPQAGGSVNISASTVNIDRGSILSRMSATETVGDVRGGDISLNVDNLNITGGGGIVAAADGLATSGNIMVSATNTVSISGRFPDVEFPQFRSRIENVYDGFEQGGVGDLTIGTEQLVLSNEGRINYTSLGGAQGPGIMIEASDSVTISSGGRIRMEGSVLQPGVVEIIAPTITMDQGAVQTLTVSVGDAGPVVMATDRLTMSQGSLITSETLEGLGSGGPITIQAADSVLLSEGSTITTSTQIAEGPAGPISINAENLISLSGTGTRLLSETNGAGDGGAIGLRADQVIVSDGATISARSTGSGNAGSVTIQGTSSPADSVLIDGAGSGIFTTTQGTGAGGNINLFAQSVTMQNSGTLSAATSGAGDAGSITANVSTLTLANASTISSSSTGTATGDAGSVTIQGLASPANSVTVTNSSLLTSAANTGRGGSITVEATNVTLDNARISASVRDFNAVDLTDSATSGLGNIALSSSTMNMTGGTISAATTGSRNAGTIGITTTGNTLTIAGGARIESTTSSGGNAGMVTINSSSANLNNGTITTSTSGSGDAGSITLTTTGNTVTLSGGSRISSSSTGTMANAGDAGSVTINAGNSFQSSGSTVATSAAQGQGGNITITASQEATLNNGTNITASSTGQGDAGNITINAGGKFFSENSSVTTQATQAGGGDISVMAGDMVRMINSQLNTSVAGGTGGGGNITIDPNFVILQNSQILANAFQGAGGNITITTQVFLPDANSIVDASSQFGVNGTVTIQSPTSNLSAVWARLQQNYTEAAALLRARCAAQVSGQYSSFVQTGRDAIPLEPGGWLLSPMSALSAGEGPGARGEGARSVVASSVLASEGGILSLRGFDQNVSWPGLGKMPSRFLSILDSGCGS